MAQEAMLPTPGMTVSARRAELATALNVRIRNLAYLTYKRPDGQPLLTYQQTLDDRDSVRQAILEHEVAIGTIINDGSLHSQQVAQPTEAQPPTNGVPNGVPQMQPVPPQAMPPPPQMAPPPQAMPFPPQPPPPAGAAAAAAAPMGGYPPPAAAGYPPPPTGMPPPYPGGYPAQGVPSGQVATQPPATDGRRPRRGAGASVAPPPPAAPPAPTGIPPAGFAAPTTQYAPPLPMAPPPNNMGSGYPPAPMAAPSPPMAPPPQYAPQPQAPANAAMDLTPLLQRIDALGNGLQAVAESNKSLREELQATKQIAATSLAALHHLYVWDANGSKTSSGKANDLPSFMEFMRQYIGAVANPK